MKKLLSKINHYIIYNFKKNQILEDTMYICAIYNDQHKSYFNLNTRYYKIRNS